jgi:hypothetical protein
MSASYPNSKDTKDGRLTVRRRSAALPGLVDPTSSAAGGQRWASPLASCGGPASWASRKMPWTALGSLGREPDRCGALARFKLRPVHA